MAEPGNRSKRKCHACERQDDRGMDFSTSAVISHHGYKCAGKNWYINQVWFETHQTYPFGGVVYVFFFLSNDNTWCHGDRARWIHSNLVELRHVGSIMERKKRDNCVVGPDTAGQCSKQQTWCETKSCPSKQSPAQA